MHGSYAVLCMSESIPALQFDVRHGLIDVFLQIDTYKVFCIHCRATDESERYLYHPEVFQKASAQTSANHQL